MEGSRTPPPGVQMVYCPKCDGWHPDCPTLTVAAVAWATGYSRSTLHTYLSRGLMPEPMRRSKGCAPRWTPCAIFCWLRDGATSPNPKKG